MQLREVTCGTGGRGEAAEERHLQRAASSTSSGAHSLHERVQCRRTRVHAEQAWNTRGTAAAGARRGLSGSGGDSGQVSADGSARGASESHAHRMSAQASTKARRPRPPGCLNRGSLCG